MASTCLVGLVLTVVIGVAFSSDQMAYEALIARIDRLEGKVEFLEHRVSTLEARDTSQQRVISEQRSTIARQQTSLRDFFVKYGQKNRSLRSRVQHLEHIIASNTRMAENTAPKQVAHTEEEQQSELAQERPESGSPKIKERINHPNSGPSMSQVPGRTASIGRPAVNRVHSNNTAHAKRLLVAASGDDGPVAFMARMDTSKSYVGIDRNFVFETVLMNIGNGYHNRQGIFIAPKAGIYMFSSAITNIAINVLMEAEIVHNGKGVCNILAKDYTQWSQSGQTALMQLAQGDEVWVRNKHRDHIRVDGNGFSTFSGYLLWPM